MTTRTTPWTLQFTRNAIVSIRYTNHSFSLFATLKSSHKEGPNTITHNSANPNLRKSKQRYAPNRAITRRLAATGLLSTFLAGLHPAAAFDNGIPEMAQFKTMPKNPGTQPVLGLQANNKLAKCDYAPNCFSTSGEEQYLLKLWKPNTGSNVMGELLETIKAYPPGQARIDKGGFSIITSSANYLYVQFESLKLGFIDDVEFAVTDGGVQVRSSSRTGFLDLGVNAKRLNWISAELRGKGWTAPAITKEDYPDYFPMLTFTYDDYIRSVLSPDDCPIPSEPLTCGGISLKPPK